MLKFIRFFIVTTILLSGTSYANANIRVQVGDEEEAFEEVFIDDINLSDAEKAMIRGHHQKIIDHHKSRMGDDDYEIIHMSRGKKEGSLRSAIRFTNSDGGQFVYQVKINKRGKAQYKEFSPDKKYIQKESRVAAQKERMESVRKITQGSVGRLSNEDFLNKLKDITTQLHKDKLPDYYKTDYGYAASAYNELKRNKNRRAADESYNRFITYFNKEYKNHKVFKDHIDAKNKKEGAYSDFNKKYSSKWKKIDSIRKRTKQGVSVNKFFERDVASPANKQSSVYGNYQSPKPKAKRSYDEYANKYSSYGKTTKRTQSQGVPVNKFFEMDVASPANKQSSVYGNYQSPKPKAKRSYDEYANKYSSYGKTTKRTQSQGVPVNKFFEMDVVEPVKRKQAFEREVVKPVKRQRAWESRGFTTKSERKPVERRHFSDPGPHERSGYQGVPLNKVLKERGMSVNKGTQQTSTRTSEDHRTGRNLAGAGNIKAKKGTAENPYRPGDKIKKGKKNKKPASDSKRTQKRGVPVNELFERDVVAPANKQSSVHGNYQSPKGADQKGNRTSTGTVDHRHFSDPGPHEKNGYQGIPVNEALNSSKSAEQEVNKKSPGIAAPNKKEQTWGEWFASWFTGSDKKVHDNNKRKLTWGDRIRSWFSGSSQEKANNTRAHVPKKKDNSTRGDEFKKKAEQKSGGASSNSSRGSSESQKGKDIINKSWRKDNLLQKPSHKPKSRWGWVSEEIEDTVDDANDALINE